MFSYRNIESWAISLIYCQVKKIIPKNVKYIYKCVHYVLLELVSFIFYAKYQAKMEKPIRQNFTESEPINEIMLNKIQLY